jgi:hypothetical protein
MLKGPLLPLLEPTPRSSLLGSTLQDAELRLMTCMICEDEFSMPNKSWCTACHSKATRPFIPVGKFKTVRNSKP